MCIPVLWWYMILSQPVIVRDRVGKGDSEHCVAESFRRYKQRTDSKEACCTNNNNKNPRGPEATANYTLDRITLDQKVTLLISAISVFKWGCPCAICTLVGSSWEFPSYQPVVCGSNQYRY
ncbi:hypothetical protein KQX54_016087 [Cotesia glomerata]|uniref:Secreted protein n=1 Tax=Cotesia glomerata TaxID=32391 RepID=A0AAV7IMG2_COTGL|nr:hypothetical protein KQX54_016087 [Cotesia glomerata]